MEKIIAYCGTKNLHEMIAASCRSVLHYSSVDTVYVFTDEMPVGVDLGEKVIWQVIENKWFNKVNCSSKYTWMAMVRAVLCELLWDKDVVLSLDCDTVCVGNIDEVWDLCLTDCYYAACAEPHKCVPSLVQQTVHHKYDYEYTYTNMGVCLYNLKILRETEKYLEVVNALNTREYMQLEQDAFNELCQEHIAVMPGKYNDCDWTIRDPDYVIKHFAGFKDWMHFPEMQAWI